MTVLIQTLQAVLSIRTKPASGVHFQKHATRLKKFRQAAFSLLELTMVVALMGIMAVVMIPDFSSSDVAKLDLAAQQLADAFRYARTESMHGGTLVGTSKTPGFSTITVKSVDQSTTPWSLVSDVYHPLSKKIYIVDIESASATRGLVAVRDSQFRGSCDTPRQIYFKHDGTGWCLSPNNIALQAFTLTLTLGGQNRVVVVDGSSGRITVR